MNSARLSEGLEIESGLVIPFSHINSLFSNPSIIFSDLFCFVGRGKPRTRSIDGYPIH